MWPKRKQGKIDDSDGNRKLTANKSYKSYNHDGSCTNDSTSCRNNIMKSHMCAKRNQAKIDGNDGGRSLTGTNNDIVKVIDVINLCSSDDSDKDNDKQ